MSKWAVARKWLYNVLTALVPLAVLYGYVENEDAAMWLAFFGALVGFPLASVNVTTQTAQVAPSAPVVEAPAPVAESEPETAVFEPAELPAP